MARSRRGRKSYGEEFLPLWTHKDGPPRYHRLTGLGGLRGLGGLARHISVASSPSPPLTNLTRWGSAIRQTGFADGALVGSDTDFSGNNNISTQTSTMRPTYRANQFGDGRPCYEYSRSQGLLIDTLASLFNGTGTPYTVSITVRIKSTSGGAGQLQLIHYVGGNADNRPVDSTWFYPDYWGYACDRFDDAGHDLAFGSGIPDFSWHVITIVFDDTNRTLWMDGQKVQTFNWTRKYNNSGSTTLGAFVTSDTYRIGTHGDTAANEGLNGYTMEDLYYPRALSYSEVLALQNYQMGVAGIAASSSFLPSMAPGLYCWFAPEGLGWNGAGSAILDGASTSWWGDRTTLSIFLSPNSSTGTFKKAFKDGHNCLQYNGTNTAFYSTYYRNVQGSNKPFEAWWVDQATDVASDRCYMNLSNGSDSGANWEVTAQASGSYLLAKKNDAGTSSPPTTGGVPDTNWHFYRAYDDGAGNVGLDVDGTSVISASGFPTGNCNWQQGSIGTRTRATVDKFFKGYFMEFAFFTQVHTGSDLTNLNNYFAARIA